MIIGKIDKVDTSSSVSGGATPGWGWFWLISFGDPTPYSSLISPQALQNVKSQKRSSNIKKCDSWGQSNPNPSQYWPINGQWSSESIPTHLDDLDICFNLNPSVQPISFNLNPSQPISPLNGEGRMDPAVEVHCSPRNSIRNALWMIDLNIRRFWCPLTWIGSPMYCLAETSAMQMRRTTKVAR